MWELLAGNLTACAEKVDQRKLPIRVSVIFVVVLESFSQVSHAVKAFVMAWTARDQCCVNIFPRGGLPYETDGDARLLA